MNAFSQGLLSEGSPGFFSIRALLRDVAGPTSFVVATTSHSEHSSCCPLPTMSRPGAFRGVLLPKFPFQM